MMSATLELIDNLTLEINQCFSDEQYEQAESLCQSALNVLDELEEPPPASTFSLLFMLCASYYFHQKYLLAFSTGMKLIAIIEHDSLTTNLEDISPQRTSFSYFLCALSALHIDRVRAHVAHLGQIGYAQCAGYDDLLHDAGHHYSQILLSIHDYPKAMRIAEQALLLKKHSNAKGGCTLGCYQRVYAESMGYAIHANTAIAYLDDLIQQSPEDAQLYLERAKNNFRLKHYQLTLLDCQQAEYFDTNLGHDTLEEALWFSFMAHRLLKNNMKANNALTKLCLLNHDTEIYMIWSILCDNKTQALTEKFKDPWVAHLSDYLTGSLYFDQLLAIAEHNDHRCESLADAYCFSAFQQELTGYFEKARTLYQQCLTYARERNKVYLWVNARLQQIK